jgi:hypothetical protein
MHSGNWLTSQAVGNSAPVNVGVVRKQSVNGVRRSRQSALHRPAPTEAR